MQRARRGGAVLGRDLLVEVVHLPPGQPGALGAGSASVLAAGFHLRIKSGEKQAIKSHFFGLIRTSREEEKDIKQQEVIVSACG